MRRTARARPMRRTARALSVAVLASAALGVLAGPSAADPGVPPPPGGAGEPVPPPVAEEPVPPPAAEEPLAPAAGQAAAEVSPADVTPGGTVTVSVSCAPTGGSAPATLDATSTAFDEGTVALRKVEGGGGTGSGPAYRGTARIAAAEDFGSEADVEGAEDVAGVAGVEEDWTVDGSCPDASGGEGDPWSASMNVPGAAPGESGTAKPACPPSAAPRRESSTHGTSCATKPPCPETAAPRGESAAAGKSCGGGTAEHGVRAGAGGTFSDSVPALVTGGVLIAGACAAAAHRLRLRLRGEDGER
ncbi:hypothetical protein ACFWR9_13315 [Streptomyces sp. NPDC058534]|uniref:hypothetical protein n=1 Tax=Streptomyces sp. NPDC058534 TaxID=3346541 RepID=UPI0036483863